MGSEKHYRSERGKSAFYGLHRLFPAILQVTILLVTAQGVRAQVSPSETLNPRAKTLEKDYLPQLIAFNQAIQSLKFPFPFLLRRYVGLPSKEDRAPDTRGLQFLKFHNQIILKISGDYKAAFNGDMLARNQRAARAFEDVVVPILHILPQQVPPTIACDGVGFEISYHVRSRDKSFDYEGAENLVVVMSRKDAFAFSRLSGEPDWQVVLNRSQVYVNQQKWGLALGERNSIPLEALDQSPSDDSSPSTDAAPKAETAARSTAPANESPGANSNGRFTNLYRNLTLGTQASGPAQSNANSSAPPAAKSGPQAGQLASNLDAPFVATKTDVDQLQARYQAQLDALAKDGTVNMHFVNYAPPSFVIFQNRVYLQITVRNPHTFDPQAGSIYKRTAQSFDLFLALQLKSLLAQIPSDPSLAGLDITVLNDLDSKPKPSSEAAEFICPLAPLRQFCDAKITNQDLINQSVILVNGVRIALNLQQVE